MLKEKESIQMTLMDFFGDVDSFTTHDAVQAVTKIKEVNPESVRARIYEGIDKGLFERCINLEGKVVRGVYKCTEKGTTTILINGDGRRLDFIADGSVDCIITDHPYEDKKAHKGGNRNFTDEYETFYYDIDDFKEKFRVLKEGSFLIEMIPDESESNMDYLYELKKMAMEVGFQYYAKVPWKKGGFVANTGRKSKNKEDILFLSKGKPQNLKPNQMKNKAVMIEHDFESEFKKLTDSIAVEQFLLAHELPVYYMSGTYGTLPTCFDFDPPAKKDRLHQAEKPAALFEAIIPYVMKKGQILLDSFSGSGSVGEAGIKTGMNTILVELKKDNCEKINNRLSKLPTVVIAHGNI